MDPKFCLRLQALCNAWHEAGRESFEKQTPNLNYDQYSPKTFTEKTKYVCLDEGRSGAFIYDKTDGYVYRLKSKYGVPNRKKPVGHIDQITGETLFHYRWH